MVVNRDRQIVHTPDGGQSPFDRATLPSLRTIQDPPHYTPYASELLALGRHEDRYGSSFHRVTTIESSLLNSQELIAGVRSDRLISRYKGLREMVLVHTRGDGDSHLEVSLTAKGVRFAKILDEITHTFGPAHQKFTSPREYRNDQELERAIKFVTILNLIKEGEERTSHPYVVADLVQSVAALALEQRLAIRYQQSYEPGEPRIIEPVFDTYGLTSRDTLMITQRGHSLYSAQG